MCSTMLSSCTVHVEAGEVISEKGREDGPTCIWQWTRSTVTVMVNGFAVICLEFASPIYGLIICREDSQPDSKVLQLYHRGGTQLLCINCPLVNAIKSVARVWVYAQHWGCCSIFLPYQRAKQNILILSRAKQRIMQLTRVRSSCIAEFEA